MCSFVQFYPISHKLTIFIMLSLPVLLKQKNASHTTLASPAFHISGCDGNNECSNSEHSQIISHQECWTIVDRHTDWLLQMIQQVLAETGDHNETPKDMIIFYLSDNSADLLMNLLACIDLTERHFSNMTNVILPAMMNVRWTPLEISRVLNPNDTKGTNASTLFVTAILYGVGYEKTAAEAITHMNKTSTEGKRYHVAITLPIPIFSPGNEIRVQRKIRHNMNSTQPSYLHNNASNEDAILLFTSGTSSGIPKGVRLSHRSLIVQALAKTQSPCSYDKNTVVAANTVPLFHIGGLSSLLAVVLSGGCLMFPCTNAGSRKTGFQPNVVLESLTTKNTATCHLGVNTLVVVPAMLHVMYEYFEKDGIFPSFPGVKLILVGGQSIGNGLLHSQTRLYFPNARIVQTYACTEAGSSITFADTTDCRRGEVSSIGGATCVGHAPSHIQVKIFDPELRPLPNGELGIIGTLGPHTMLGYWNRGDILTTKPVETNSWMLTSDLGYIHPMSGELYFSGRVNDVIRTGGESVMAIEVEKVLTSHPDLFEVAVFGLPDEKFGEVVCAAAVSKNSTSSLMEDKDILLSIRQHCAKQQLAGFKHPRRIFCMQSLPRNSSGKVLKQQIIRSCSQLLATTSRL